MQSISTAILSYGMSGRVFHAPLLTAAAGFSLDAVVMRNGGLLDKYPKAKICTSIDDVLGLTNIELVVVNLPSELHFDVALAALNAGKHVVVEKPFTVTSVEAEKLIEQAKARKKLLTVFQNRRWDGDFMTVQKIIEEKRLGRVVEYEAHYDRFRNIVQANTWKEESGPGRGILYNLGSHMIDQAITLFGAPQFVDARVGIQRTGGQVDDFYDIRLEYQDKLVILKSSYLVREPGPRYSIHGEYGSFVKYGLDPQEQALADGKKPGSSNWGVEPKEFWGKLNTEVNDGHYNGLVETIAGNYSFFYDGVFQAIRNNKQLPVLPEQAWLGIKIIEASYDSNRLKRAIKLDLK